MRTMTMKRGTLAGCVLLLLAGAVHLGGAQGGNGGKTAFEARAERGDFTPSGLLSPFDLLSPLVTGDTAVEDPFTDHCEGANSVPDNNRGFFTSFRNCMVDFTLPGKDGDLDGVGDITMDRGFLSATQDRTTGNVVAIRFFFNDTNGNEYDTDVLLVGGASPVSTTGFTIHVHAENEEVRPKGAGNKPVVGHVSIGDIVYTPK